MIAASSSPAARLATAIITPCRVTSEPDVAVASGPPAAFSRIARIFGTADFWASVQAVPPWSTATPNAMKIVGIA